MPIEKPDSTRASLLSRARQAFRGAEQGASVIARHAKTAPTGPGVYRMIDAAGEVLYIGKARGLKKRVQSYARAGSHNNRIARMIADTASMEFVTTATETEALLLEANLIKRLKPRYNVVLRDDKSFPFILIAREHRIPQIMKHRGARSRKGDYFGPFASAGAVGRTINTLQRAFLLRSCSDAYFESRVRPCLLYQIKRCSAPCTGQISEADYAGLVDEALRFLTGESDEVKRRLHKLMDDASLKQDYERAASFRDRLTALSHVQSHQGINPQTVKEADVFAAHQEAGQTAIQVFFFRTGNNWGNRAYFPRADKSLAVEAGARNPLWPNSTTTSRRRSSCCCPTILQVAGCSAKPCRCAPATRSACSRHNGEKSVSSSPTPSSTRARCWRAAWQNPPRKPPSSHALSSCSSLTMCPSVSRCSTTAISPAPTPSAP